MKLLQLRYFLAISQTENISQVARTLHISQPSLSRSLKELEQEVGTPLFVRNGHSLKLNESGSLFRQRITSAITLIDHAVLEVHQLSTNKDNHVILRTISSSPIIPNLVHFLKNELPDIKIQLVQSSLENEELTPYDFELSTQPIKGNVNQLLVHEEIMVAVSQQSQLANLKKIKLNELKHQSLILTNPSPLRTLIESFLNQESSKIQPTFITSDRTSIHDLTAENLGISFIPAFSWRSFNLTGIHLVHIDPVPLTRNIYLSYPAELETRQYHQQVATKIQKFFTSQN